MARNEQGGAALSVLSSNVVHLDEPTAVFEGMLEGWSNQQRSRMLSAQTVAGRDALVRRFHAFTGTYPWEWTPVDVEDFTTSLVSGASPLARSTVRTIHNSLSMFMEYLTDPVYPWSRQCEERFGASPVQICTEFNQVAHRNEFEGRPDVRPLSYEELESFFGRCDERVEEIRSRKKKGSLAALRDAQLFKTYYAWGLRRNEAVNLDLADLRRNAHKAEWGRFGALYVRHGKAAAGGPPKRRSVMSVPDFDWAIEGLEQYVTEVRPAFGAGAHPALWVTERRSRVAKEYVDARFAQIRDEAGLAKELHLHCLRHSYVTHLIEFGYAERFVQEQVGHAYASTTAIYAGVSGDFKNQVLAEALKRVYGPGGAKGATG